MKKLKGSITVFIALIFLSVLALVCIVLESVRISSAETRARGVTNIALDSCFAKYGKELFDEFGILFLWNSEDEIINTYKTVAECNCDVDKGLKLKGNDILGLTLKNVEIKDVCYCIDDNGEVFENQVYEYMIQKLGSDAVKALLGKINKLSQGEKVSEFYNSMKNCKDIFSGAEETVMSVKKEIDLISDISGKPADNIEKIIASSQEIENTSDIRLIAALKKQIKAEYEDYNKWSEQINNSLLAVKEGISQFKQCSIKAKEEAEKLSRKAEELGKELDNDICEAINSQIKEIADKFNDNDGYGIGRCEEAADRLCGEINQINVVLSEFVDGEMDVSDELVNVLEIAGKLDFSQLFLNVGDVEAKEIKSDIEGEVGNLWEKGILSLVTDSGDEISETTVDLSGVPSNNVKEGGGKSKYSISEELMRRAVFGEYILTHFGCYTEQKENRKLKYEVEYILEGKDSDRENLRNIAEKIVAIRSGFNMISIFKDSAKMKETYAVAAAVAGATGMPLVIKLVQVGIISAWSGAESFADVKNLLKGKRVALIKSSDQWNLSLKNIANLNGIRKKGDDEGGLSYKDYLRYILSLNDRDVQVFRTMDAIELYLNGRYNDKFKMKDCISSITLTSEYQIKKLFLMFVPSVGARDMYNIKVSQRYSY